MGRRALGRALQVLGMTLIALGIVGYLPLPSPQVGTPPQQTQTQPPLATAQPTITQGQGASPTTTTIPATTELAGPWVIRSLYGENLTNELWALIREGAHYPNNEYVEWLVQAINGVPGGYEAVLTTALTGGGGWRRLSPKASVIGSAEVLLLEDGSAGLIVTPVIDSDGAYFIIHGFAYPHGEWVDLFTRTYLLMGDLRAFDPLGPRTAAIDFLYNQLHSIRAETVLWRVFIEGRGSYIENEETGETIPVKGAYLLLEIPRLFYTLKIGPYLTDQQSGAS